MEIINHLKKGVILYPVGEHMDRAIQFIDAAAPLVQNIIGEKALNIWCRGSSGAILASLLVAKLSDKNTKKILHVKKKGETSHHGNCFYISSSEVNLIIDDFCETGETLNKIYEKLSAFTPVVDILLLDQYSRTHWLLNFVPEIFISESSTNTEHFRILEPTK
jgi:hypothetical protein